MKNKDYRYYLIKDRGDMAAILVIAAVLILFFGAYAGPYMQTDTYAKWFYSIGAYRYQYLTNVRFGEWLYMEFFYRIMGEPQHFRAFHVAVGLCLDIIIVYLLWKTVCRECKLEDSAKLKAFALLPAVTFRANVFYSDIFQFGVDTAPMFIGDLLAVCGALIFSYRKGRKGFIMGTFLLTSSLFFRQTCLFWFLFTNMIILFCDSAEEKQLKVFLRKFAGIAASVMIAVIPVLICINTIAPDGSRGTVEHMDFASSWEAFRTCLLSLLRDCAGVQPRWFYTALLLTAGLFLLYVLYNCRKTEGKKLSSMILLKILLVTASVFSGIFFTAVFETFLPHRTTCGFAALFPFFTVISLRLKKYWPVGNVSGILLIICACLFLNLCVNYLYVVEIRRGLAETNRIDLDNAHWYLSQIEKYEKNTGNTITGVAWHYDEQYTWGYKGIISPYALNDRVYSFPWGQREIFPFSTGRRFSIIDFDEDLFQKYFVGMDWDGLSEDQLLFIGNTVYIVLY